MKKNPYRSSKALKGEAQRVLDYVEGGSKASRGRTIKLVFAPKDIKFVRAKILKLSQSGFGRLLKKEPISVQSWEQGRRIPDDTTAMLIYLLSKHKQLKGWMERSATFSADKIAA